MNKSYQIEALHMASLQNAVATESLSPSTRSGRLNLAGLALISVGRC